MTARADELDGEQQLLTVDELAAVTGMTVRTTRYYAGLGLLPPPERRGRMAYYSTQHRARLELIRALQDHGFTLSAIEKYLARLPLDASVEDLAIQRVMLTSWRATPQEVVSRRQLEVRARRPVDDDDCWPGSRRPRRSGATATSSCCCRASRSSIKLLELDLPIESLVEADAAITPTHGRARRRADRRSCAPGCWRRTANSHAARRRRPGSSRPWPGCASSRWRRSCPASSARPTR